MCSCGSCETKFNLFYIYIIRKSCSVWHPESISLLRSCETKVNLFYSIHTGCSVWYLERVSLLRAFSPGITVGLVQAAEDGQSVEFKDLSQTSFAASYVLYGWKKPFIDVWDPKNIIYTKLPDRYEIYIILLTWDKQNRWIHLKLFKLLPSSVHPS